MKRFAILVAFVLLSVEVTAQSANKLRVVTYNLLNYPGTTASQRNVAFRTIIGAIGPDIMISQEVQSDAGVRLFLRDVLNVVRPDAFAAAPFNDGPDTDNAFFYDSTKVAFAGASYIATELRNIAEYRFLPRGSSDTVHIFSTHLKASEGEEQQRLSEINLLAARIDALPAGTRYIVAGDFNIYTSTEPAYQALTGRAGDAPARCVDPIDSPGDWSKNPSFSKIHTQSPRVRQFEGGAPGGMDDRFDMILVSPSLAPAVDVASYTAFGNDGRHYNDSINRLPNLVVADSVASALHAASDHLPVFVDFAFAARASAPAASMARLLRLSVAPQPISRHARVSFSLPRPAHATLTIFNALGQQVARPIDADLDGGAHETLWHDDLPSGVYIVELRAGELIETARVVAGP